METVPDRSDEVAMRLWILDRSAVIVAELGDPLAAVVAEMEGHGIDSVPVTSEGTVVGIITERDIIRGLSEGRDPVTTPVREYMTRLGDRERLHRRSDERAAASRGREVPVKVQALYHPNAVTAAAEESLADAVARMEFNEIGALPVLRHGQIVGIITERDLTRALGDGVDPEIAPVEEYMSAEPVTIDLEADAADAAATMLRIAARHLPVVEGGRLVGMLSVRDLLALEAWDSEVDRWDAEP